MGPVQAGGALGMPKYLETSHSTQIGLAHMFVHAIMAPACKLNVSDSIPVSYSIMTKEGQMTEKLIIGKPAPDFSLPIDGGGTFTLSSLKGRKVVLYFYPKDDTPGCTKEAMDFNRLKGEFAKAGADIIGLSPDNVASHGKFRKKHGLDFPLASDEEKTTLEAYGVWVEKSMYGRKYMGVERTTVLVGADGLIKQIWPKVKVPGHADEVLAAAKAA